MHTPEFLTLDGKSIEYYRIPAARRDAPVLVFLHEGLGCAALWRDFPTQVAAATGCGALVYSRWGYGRSAGCTLPRPLRYMHDEALQVLPRLLDALQIEDTILVGHSDGGSIGLIYAGGIGCQRVRALITLAAHIFCEELSVQSIAAIRDVYLTGDLRAKLQKYHGANVDNAFWGWNDVWLSPEFRYWNIEEYLPAITAPLLVIQGIDDQYGTKSQVERLEAQVSGLVESVLLAECGHSPQREQNALTVATIQAFVQQLL